ncbi:MAG: SHD1 domain-containing protein [Verrucomicrobiales bacterium]
MPFLIFSLVAICNAELRTWTAVNGKKVEAEFVSNSDGQVALKMKTGKIFKVPLNNLSKGDQEFLNLNISKDDQKSPTVDELIAAMGTPLNKFEKNIADKKYIEKFEINTADPNLRDGFEPAETINRTNRTYSILYTDNGVKELVHGIWMIKGNDLYYIELVADGKLIPFEEREVFKLKIITLDKDKILFSQLSLEENLDDERITWESIEKFTSREMIPFNKEINNKNFTIFKNNKDEFSKLFKGSVLLSSLQDRGIDGYFEKNAGIGFTGSVYMQYPLGFGDGLLFNGRMKNGKYNGEMKVWHGNGHICMKLNFVNGTPDGKNTVYFPNGKKEVEVVLKNGNLVEGTDKAWNQSGREITEKGIYSRFKGGLFFRLSRGESPSQFYEQMGLK